MNQLISNSLDYLSFDVIEEATIESIDAKIERLKGKKISVQEKQKKSELKEKQKSKLARSVRDKAKHKLSVNAVEGVVGTKDERYANQIDAIGAKIELLEMQKEKIHTKKTKERAKVDKQEEQNRKKREKKDNISEEQLRLIVEEGIKEFYNTHKSVLWNTSLGALGGIAMGAAKRNKSYMKWGAFAGGLTGLLKYLHKYEKQQEQNKIGLIVAKRAQDHLEQVTVIGDVIDVTNKQLNTIDEIIDYDATDRLNNNLTADYTNAIKAYSTVHKIFFNKNKRDNKSLRKVESLLLYISDLIKSMIATITLINK